MEEKELDVIFNNIMGSRSVWTIWDPIAKRQQNKKKAQRWLSCILMPILNLGCSHQVASIRFTSDYVLVLHISIVSKPQKKADIMNSPWSHCGNSILQSHLFFFKIPAGSSSKAHPTSQIPGHSPSPLLLFIWRNSNRASVHPSLTAAAAERSSADLIPRYVLHPLHQQLL